LKTQNLKKTIKVVHEKEDILPVAENNLDFEEDIL
jgi:hypothetical protein